MCGPCLGSCMPSFCSLEIICWSTCLRSDRDGVDGDIKPACASPPPPPPPPEGFGLLNCAAPDSLAVFAALPRVADLSKFSDMLGGRESVRVGLPAPPGDVTSIVGSDSLALSVDTVSFFKLFLRRCGDVVCAVVDIVSPIVENTRTALQQCTCSPRKLLWGENAFAPLEAHWGNVRLSHMANIIAGHLQHKPHVVPGTTTVWKGGMHAGNLPLNNGLPEPLRFPLPTFPRRY